MANTNLKALKIIALLFAVVGVVVIATVSSCVRENTLTEKQESLKKINEQAIVAILKDTQGLIEECEKIGDDISLPLAGKALVADIRPPYDPWVRGAQEMLPESLRAQATDRPITVFMVQHRRSESVGFYMGTNVAAPASRQYLDIYIALWPDKKPLGSHTMVVEPPGSISYNPSRQESPQEHQEHFVKADREIAEWIANLYAGWYKPNKREVDLKAIQVFNEKVAELEEENMERNLANPLQ